MRQRTVCRVGNKIGNCGANTQMRNEHRHLFVESDPTLCVAEIVNRLKGRSSRVLRQEFPTLRSRLPTLWSRSDYAGTVGQVSQAIVKRYIESQKGK